MRSEVSQDHPDKTIDVEFMSLDLSSLQSVKNFIEDYKQKGLPLHLLINNTTVGLWGEPDVCEYIHAWHIYYNLLHYYYNTYITFNMIPVYMHLH